jgi:hypothetical protein
MTKRISLEEQGYFFKKKKEFGFALITLLLPTAMALE